ARHQRRRLRPEGSGAAQVRVNMRAPSSILPVLVRDVIYVAGGRVIIDRVSFELTAGPRTVILGANGAGKSVLMRLMHGLLTPSTGTIAWNRDDPARRQAMVFQRPVMLRRSALANLEYGLQIARVPPAERRQRALAALEGVGLAALAQRPARVLSGGEQQRLALARAWALRPEVLFLDEPTASLDPKASRAVEDIVRSIHGRGTTIVMSTHNLAQAKRLAGHVVFLQDGRQIEQSPAQEFFVSPRTSEAAA